MVKAVIGIDVGTGSVRAGVFDMSGKTLAVEKRDIALWREQGDIVEQSSADIWEALCATVSSAVRNAGIDPKDVSGVGVDATCSLVVVDGAGNPLPVGPSGDPSRNIIVWMDHRAIDPAQRINRTGHRVLEYVGGQISPEMEIPKILWLKEHLPKTYAKGEFFDLADYLTFRLTGDRTRSSCTVTCKWTYLAHEGAWDHTFFDEVGLPELPSNPHRIGTRIVEPGTSIGNGLSEDAARLLGLQSGIPVGAALIDAHAGGFATVGADGAGPPGENLAYIFGTSACAMATTATETFVPGVWGPYFSAMVPGVWLNEAGQSAAGAAIDYLIDMHPAAHDARTAAERAGLPLIAWIEHRAIHGATDLGPVALRAKDIHVVPDFNGNRSPFADPLASAIVSGLRADRSEDALVDLYVSGVCGIAYGLSQIIDALRAKGVNVQRTFASGGASRSRLVLQILADATGLPVAVTESQEPVILGAAMLGAIAANAHGSPAQTMRSMSRLAQTYQPGAGSIRDFHSCKKKIHAMLQDAERRARSMQEETAPGRH